MGWGSPRRIFKKVENRLNSILQGEPSQSKEKYSQQKLNLESKLRVAQEKIARAETELKTITTETALLVERGDKIFSGIVPVRSFSEKKSWNIFKDFAKF